MAEKIQGRYTHIETGKAYAVIGLSKYCLKPVVIYMRNDVMFCLAKEEFNRSFVKKPVLTSQKRRM